MKLDPKKWLASVNRTSWGIVSCLFKKGTLPFFCLLVLSSFAIAAVPNEEEEIRSSFQELQKALSAKDGTQALNLLSSDTKDYYRMLSKIASTPMTQKGLEQQHLTPLNLLMIKHVKRVLPKDFWNDYKKTNPDKLLKFAIDKGLGSKELTDNIRLGVVQVNGETALGKLIKGPKPLPLQIAFLKESGKWKISLISMFEQANRKAEEFLKKSGIKIEDLEKLIIK